MTSRIPQEPADPEPTRRSTSFSVRLLLSPDGSRAFAEFEGAVVTAKPGPPPPGAARNVSVNGFESLVSFDLAAFRVSAARDLTEHQNQPANVQELISNGELFRLYLTDTEWKIVVLDGLLHEVQTVTVSAAPVDQSARHWCELRSDLKIECPVKGGGNLLLSSDSVVQLAPSTCSMTLRRSAFEVGKDELVKGYVTEADRLCTRDESGKENLVSADLLPHCPHRWHVAAISPDHRSLLTSCIVTELVLDSFFSHNPGDAAID